MGVRMLVFLTLVGMTWSQQLSGNAQCQIHLNSCVYALKLLPLDNGQEQCKNVEIEEEDSAREKRSYQQDQADNYSGTDNEETDNYRGRNKFERKLIKSMNRLSVRLLRGVRRIEEQVEELMESGEKKTLIKKCPIGFTTIDNWPSCYMFSNFDMNWYQAKEYCAAFDSDLVSLGTTREHFIITYFIKNNQEYNAAKGWWTSGSFVVKTKQWMWTAQLFLKPFSFIKWAPGEPNEPAASCMLLAGNDDHLWNDDLCTNRYNFVCEADARSV